ncbi:MAG: DUF2220 family protein [Sulfurovum sp.]|nr:DUF2220 family protein [Sulfurovum sp.]
MPLKLQTPKDLNKKLTKSYTQAQHLKAYMREETFRIEIKFRRLSEKEIEQHFEAVRDWVMDLNQSTFDVSFETISYRSLGDQLMPKFLSMGVEGFLQTLLKQKSYMNHCILIDKILTTFPQLQEFLLAKPKLIMEYDEVWERVLLVCKHFLKHPNPSVYMRELEIESVDTKFIESHKKIIDTILSILDEREVVTLAQHGFEKRYGLKYDLPSIRFRILDKNHFIAGLSDITLPLNEFMTLDIACEKVFITENKINGLSFPQMSSAIVIFGLGYGIESLKEVQWLQNKKLYYWGDIDTHGFAILSQFRSYFPHAESMLMNEEILLKYKNMATQENETKRFMGELGYLSKAEEEIFLKLKEDFYAKYFRLEQERIGFESLARYS